MGFGRVENGACESGDLTVIFGRGILILIIAFFRWYVEWQENGRVDEENIFLDKF